jgi:SPP1 gp7 family putative phage head morphogenesis protein
MNPSGFASAIASSLTHDIRLTKAQRRAESKHFSKVRTAERWYSIQLRKIARHVGEIIKHFKIGDPTVVPEVQSVLRSYAQIITPWAKATGERMVAEVSRRDELAWKRTAQRMSRDLHKEIADAPIGEIVRQLQNDQVHLITSIPLEAAQRVQELTQEYVLGGKRYDELIPMIINTTGVTLSRATLIARTETAKAASSLVQARALHIGSDSYIWHSVQDIYVRKTHRNLNGTIHKWSDPPIAEDNGDRHHPGNFPNCRCFAEPVIPDFD